MKQTLTREELLQELGIKILPTEVQDEIIAVVGENIMKAVLLAVMLKLPKDAQEEFKRLTDTHKPDAVDALLKKHIPDIETFAMEEARKELAAYKESLDKKLAEK